MKRSPAIIREVVIMNKLGLHARAASKLVKLCSGYRAEVFLMKDGVRVNAKSIMGILMLAAGMGSRLTLEVSGNDAEVAMRAVVKLIEEDRFDER